MATFNVLEAAVRCGVKRLVNISSETVPGESALQCVQPALRGTSRPPRRTAAASLRGIAPARAGFFFPEVPFNPPYCPVDELTPAAPQDPYALSKVFGEQMCDAAIRRAPGTSIVTIRPSWVQTPATIAHNLGRYVRDTEHELYQPGMWAYIWVDDLAEAVRSVGGTFSGRRKDRVARLRFSPPPNTRVPPPPPPHRHARRARSRSPSPRRRPEAPSTAATNSYTSPPRTTRAAAT